MAKSFGIRFKDNVTPRLQKIGPNVQNAINQGAIESMSRATGAIRTQVAAAHTRTGTLRASGGKPQFAPRAAWFAGRGPGRIESGRMLASARWQIRSTGDQVLGTAGFINAPSYTAKQELGDGRIPPMLAFAKGHTTMTAIFNPVMSKYAERAVRYAGQGRSMGRDF